MCSDALLELCCIQSFMPLIVEVKGFLYLSDWLCSNVVTQVISLYWCVPLATPAAANYIHFFVSWQNLAWFTHWHCHEQLSPIKPLNLKKGEKRDKEERRTALPFFRIFSNAIKKILILFANGKDQGKASFDLRLLCIAWPSKIAWPVGHPIFETRRVHYDQIWILQYDLQS